MVKELKCNEINNAILQRNLFNFQQSSDKKSRSVSEDIARYSKIQPIKDNISNKTIENMGAKSLYINSVIQAKQKQQMEQVPKLSETKLSKQTKYDILINKKTM